MIQNQKAQSALEYLMTYGWALVVIVIVVAALVLLIGSPGAANDTCSGAASKLVISNQDLGVNGWQLVIKNISGRPMSNIDINAVSDVNAGGANANTDTAYSIAGTISPGASATIGPASFGQFISGTRYRTDFNFAFSDGDLQRTTYFSCVGKPP